MSCCGVMNMKRIMDEEMITARMKDNPYCEFLQDLKIPVFLIEYMAGEFVSAPWEENALFQIVSSGTVDIYYVRDDGSRYSLAQGSEAYCLGEMELFDKSDMSVFAQAVTDVICLAFSISENRDYLFQNNQFLRMVCRNMSVKLSAITMRDAASSSLAERVWNYMNYKCDDRSFKGIEKMSFQLHCSARQLQRIMNEFEKQGVAKKAGKGAYKLIEI